MSDVFISYARSTAKQAQQVAEALRGLGYGVWIDDDLPAHRTYSRVIEEEMAAAKAAVVIWSADAVKSEWVLSEANRAREDHKLVQVTSDTARLPMPFDTIQCADLAGWSGDLEAAGWKKVAASVGELVGRAGSPPSWPTAVEVVSKPPEPLLAVLAFDNLSGDPEMAYFSDGVSEEIQQTVAHGSDLKVIGRNSSFQFRGADKASSHVASKLGATHVLDGSVRRSGPRVRISAQLVECARETTLWSDRFDRDLSDVFALQDEIAGAVAAALKVAFAPPTPADAVDPATYDLFLRAKARGKFAVDPAKQIQTIRMLERVVAAAPKLGRAWSSLAECRAGLVRFHAEAAPQYGLSRESARDAAEAALNLDAGLGMPYVALSFVEAWAHYEEREALLRKALDAAPNDPQTLDSMAYFLGIVGRRRDKAAYNKQAYDLDPLDVDVACSYASQHYDRGRWESLFAHWPDNDVVPYGAIFHAACNADWEAHDAFVAASRARITTDPSFRDLFWLTRNLRDPYPLSLARGMEQTRHELSRTGTLPLNVLTSLSQLGMTEEVFGLIEQASFAYVFDEAAGSPSGVSDPGVMFTLANMAMIRDPRFVGLCAKLGLCAYWVKTERWPDCVDEVAYDFKAEARLVAGAAA